MALPQKRSARNIIILMETINERYQTPRGGHRLCQRFQVERSSHHRQNPGGIMLSMTCRHRLCG
jgi:hypothetical protein